MFDKDYAALLPRGGESFGQQLLDCLNQLAAGAPGRKAAAAGRISKLTLFVASANASDFGRKTRRAAAVFRSFFRRALPPFSVVAQPPENGWKVALFAEVLSKKNPPLVVRYRCLRGFRYCSVRSGRNHEIIGAGLTLRPPRAGYPRMGTAAQSAGALEVMRDILRREHLGPGDVVRQWNFIEDLLRVRPARCGHKQNYQEFNDMRSVCYRGSVFPSGYPAATGIGQAHGGVVVEFQAEAPAKNLVLVPLSNPLQNDAHRYSQEVLIGGLKKEGSVKSAPLFERAKFSGRGGSGVIHISGTASIRDQATAYAGDAEAQTRTTIENIRALISGRNLRNHGISWDGPSPSLAYLRVYVKRPDDLPAVKKIFRESFGPVPSHFMVADICRDDLLVEIEGMARVDRPGWRRGPRESRRA